MWGLWVSKLLNSPSDNFKKQLILHKIFNLPAKTLQFESNQLKHSPLRHVHFLWVHHTWLDFSRQNPNEARQEYQDLCGTQLLLIHQWKFLRSEAGLDTYYDTMLNLMKHMIFRPTWIQWEKKVAKEREEFSRDRSITHFKIAHTWRQNWKYIIATINQWIIYNTMV